MLYTFANCSGLDLIFGLNALLRTADLRWNSSNAQLLLDYCSSRSYNISWELGNGKCPWEHFINKEIPLWHCLFLFMTFFLILANILLSWHICASVQQCNFWDCLWRKIPLYVPEAIANLSLCYL